METAARAAKASGYVNAGTVEFLMDRDQNFYFMEMNTRLQVEHPVSELVTGVDIVKWQIRIAAGVPLDFTQEDITVQGAAIECRINAVGPGKVDFFHTPGGPWVRFDTFLYQGYEIPPYYDSMLGKMIVYSSTREEAIRKMTAALSELVIGGTRNNIEDQIAIIRDERFKKGDYYTDFMKTFQKAGNGPAVKPHRRVMARYEFDGPVPLAAERAGKGRQACAGGGRRHSHHMPPLRGAAALERAAGQSAGVHQLRVPFSHGTPGPDQLSGGRGQLCRAVRGSEEPGCALLPRV